jgi:hypothetical protein
VLTIWPATAWFCIGILLLSIALVRIFRDRKSTPSWQHTILPPIMLLTGFLTAKLYWNFGYDILLNTTKGKTSLAIGITVALCAITPPLLAAFVWSATQNNPKRRS